MESSRKTESHPPLAPGGCPRCGARLGEEYKYCPHCAYRLRPDLVPTSHVAVAAPPLSQRLVALGGYLLFAAMLLLVVFAGVRLFAQPEPANPVQPNVIRSRDPERLALTLDEFVDVPAGKALFGPYDPLREALPSVAEAAGEEKQAADLVAGAIAELGDETASPEQIVEARRVLQEEILLHPTIEDMIRHLADAFRTVVPHDPVAGLPDAWEVETPFRMSRREVTNDQYFEFLRAWAKKSGRPVPRFLFPVKWKRKTGGRDVPRIYNEGEGDWPVVGIPFDAALEFCGWFWEERLGADPDLVVDLPTWKEFVLAARSDRLANFPWGRTLNEAKNPPNLDSPGPWSVTVRKDGGERRRVRESDFYNGFLDLVGNAAEWVYSWSEDGAMAAGWSCDDGWVQREQGGTLTPFSSEGFRIVPHGQSRPHLGFRPVIRRAPRLPSFVAVGAGPVRHQPCPTGLLPPERLDVEEPGEGEFVSHETLDQIRARRKPPVSFALETEQVTRGFDISATEITNRQYLAFLAAIAPGHTKDELLGRFLPTEWGRESLFVRRGEYRVLDDDEDERPVARAFLGYYPPREHLDKLYTAGQENAPVQGITIEQAEEYSKWLSGRLGRRCTIPTAAQYLRAGRGDGIAPYPWGDSRADRELAPSYRREEVPRAFALWPWPPERPIVGLAGNVAELVRSDDGRLLLAGGFYYLPARLATLDCFLDADWANVQFVIEPEDVPEEEEEAVSRDPLRPMLSPPLTLERVTGFRVVRLPDPF